MMKISQLALSVVAVAPIFAAVPSLKQQQVVLTFEPNRGQADSHANFVARGAGYFLTLDPSGSQILLRKGGRAAAIGMELNGANPETHLTGVQLLQGHSSYFRGNDPAKWIKGLPNFARVASTGVYPGIDLLYYGNQAKLEYDFVVAPGADPNRIQLRMNGVESLSLDQEGNLSMHTAAGDLLQHKPVVYQTVDGARQAVAGNFRIGSDNLVSFAIGPYNRSLPLTIDPTLVYSTFLGGADTDEGHAIASDSAANTYMTGVTFSTQAGDADVLIRKISADGTTFLYTMDMGGSDNDYGNGLAVDANGFAFIGGRTRSLDFPTQNAFQSNNLGINNAFIVRLDPTGTNIIFSTYVGGSNDDRGYALALGPAGNAYLAGVSTSTDFPTSSNAYQQNNRGGLDAFVFKISPSGAGIYSTLIGGGSDDVANGIAIDGNGNATIGGDTNSDSFPQANAPYQHSRHGGLEGFVTQLNGDGSQLIFSTFIGGSGDDSVGGVAIDLSNNVYVVGTTTTDNNFSVPNRSYNTSYNGGASDLFVAKYSANGQNLAWTTFLGSHGTDNGNAIAVDNNGNVYVAGDTDSNQYPVTPDAIQGNRNGGIDAVLSVLDTNGVNLLYSTFYGGSGDDSAYGIALDQYAEVFLTGATSSGDLAISQAAVQSLPGGGSSDAFLAKISVYGSNIPGATGTFIPTPAGVAVSQNAAVNPSGRGMIAPQTAGKFNRKVRQGGAGVEPERFNRRVPTATSINR